MKFLKKLLERGRMLAWCVTLMVSGMVSGCVSLLPKGSTPPEEVTLGSLERYPQKGMSSKSLVLKIDKTSAPAPLQAQRILIITQEKGILSSSYLANLIWNEPLADLVQYRLVEELRQGGVFKGVGHGHEPFRPDLLYLPALHHFEIIKTLEGAYQARVSLSLREVDYQDRTLKREKIFRQVLSVKPALQAFLSGLNQAFLSVLQEAVTWVEAGHRESPHDKNCIDRKEVRAK